MFAWCLAFGWRERLVPVGEFGSLRVSRLDRLDLMAMKIVGAPRRPQDYADIAEMRPTALDLDWLDAHLDRLAAEHLGGEEFQQQRAMVGALRSSV